MSAYYNEIDPYAAQWLRNLIDAGHIARGVVDTRDVRDVRPSDLDGFTQCHFFAGVGIWSYALRLAGWGDDQPVWTASCPCQPFSAAGAGLGFADERHLWPHIHWLVEQCRPQTLFGEQVASKDGLAWFDTVSADMEATDYAIGGVDTCAAGFGAPHIRQRLYFAADNLRPATVGMADTDIRIGEQGREVARRRNQGGDAQSWAGLGSGGRADGMRNPIGKRLEGQRGDVDGASGRQVTARSGFDAGYAGWLGHSKRDGRWQHGNSVGAAQGKSEGQPWKRERFWLDPANAGAVDRPAPTNGFWRVADWLYCRDGRWRPVRSGSFPLAYGATSRMGRLRAFGNGLCAYQAAGFIISYMERDMVILDHEPAGDLFEWGLA